MSELPPKQGPETTSDQNTDESAGGMLAMYNAAGSGGDSFPVLKAFQDYIEAERSQARTRMIQLTTLFSVLIVLVVAGFLVAGMAMWKKNTETESKLLEALLTMKNTPPPAPAPAQPPPAPIINIPDQTPIMEESIRQMSRITTDLQSSLDKKLDGVTDLTSKVHEKVASQESEFEKMRTELQKMQEQSTRLKDELAAVKEAATKPQLSPPPQPPPAPAPPPPAPPAQPKVAAPAMTETIQPAQPAKAEPAPLPTPVVAKRDKRFPPAVKDPPPPAEITAPDPPKGMVTTSIPVKGKNLGTIPWRVIIPE